MNKKGFTLVEILATLAVLSFVTGIAVMAYTSIVESSKLRAFKTYEKTMYAEAMHLMIESTYDPEKASYFPNNGQTKRLSLSDIDIDPFQNPRNKNDLCPTSYVDVTRTVVGSVDSFTYKVCLICKNSDYNVNGTSCEIYDN